ncbi:hypothetical protein HID58_020635, partial [Brassica napus]
MQSSIKIVDGKSTNCLQADSSKTINLKVDEEPTRRNIEQDPPHGDVMQISKKTVSGKNTINIEADCSKIIDLKNKRKKEKLIYPYSLVEPNHAHHRSNSSIKIVDGNTTICLDADSSSSKTINLKIDEAPTRPYIGHDLPHGDVMQISKM